jgi:carotene epsilon-monooxygenase
MEAVIALAVMLKRFEFSMVPDQDIGMTTGATIHTQNGLYMTVKERQQRGPNGQLAGALEVAALSA